MRTLENAVADGAQMAITTFSPCRAEAAPISGRFTRKKMVQGRGGPGLAAEAFERVRIVGNLWRQKLQRDESSEFGIFGLVDDAHAPATEFLDDAIVRNHAADHAGTC